MKHLLLSLTLILVLGLPARAQDPPPAKAETENSKVVALSMGKQVTAEELEPDEQLIRLNKTALDDEAFKDWR